MIASHANTNSRVSSQAAPAPEADGLPASGATSLTGPHSLVGSGGNPLMPSDDAARAKMGGRSNDRSGRSAAGERALSVCQSSQAATDFSSAERVSSGKARSLRLVIGSIRAGGETALQRVSNADAGATPNRDDRPACSELYSPWTVSKARYW